MSRDLKRVGDLSFGSPPFLYVTWEIPVFFQAAKECGYFLESSKFPFGDCDYCLRLCLSETETNGLELKLVKRSHTVPRKEVSYEFGLMSNSGEEILIGYIDSYREITASERRYYFSLPDLTEYRDSYFPNGTVTVFCSMRPIEPSSAGSLKSDAVETMEVCRNYIVFSPTKTRRNIGTGMNGNLSFGTPSFLQVAWKIPFFHRMAKGSEYSLESPEFSFAGCGFCLRLFWTARDSDVKVQLVNRKNSVPGTDVAFEVVLKSRTGREISLRRRYTSIAHREQLPFYITRSDLKQEIDSYVPDRILTVFCFLRLRQPKSSVVETSEKEVERGGLPDIVKLQSDYRQLLQRGMESDTHLLVCGTEFRAHRCVLRARSPVFDAMFSHDTAEKQTRQVVITDLESQSFGYFLGYLYTGCVDEAGLSDDNAYRLYQAADKYDVPSLRSECVAHMLKYLSVDTFCPFVKVALQHQERDLLTPAVEYFKENRERIIASAKWKAFWNDDDMDVDVFLVKAGVNIEDCEE